MCVKRTHIGRSDKNNNGVTNAKFSWPGIENLAEDCLKSSIAEKTVPLSFAEVIDNRGSGPSLAAWFRPLKDSPKPERVKVRVHQLAQAPGPEPKPPLTAEIKVKPKAEMTTLRLLAPRQYRQIFLGSSTQDTPVTVISAWATVLGCQVNELTGGTWETLQLPRGPCLIGHLRVPLSLGQKAAKLSGKRGQLSWLARA